MTPDAYRCLQMFPDIMQINFFFGPSSLDSWHVPPRASCPHPVIMKREWHDSSWHKNGHESNWHDWNCHDWSWHSDKEQGSNTESSWHDWSWHSDKGQGSNTESSWHDRSWHSDRGQGSSEEGKAGGSQAKAAATEGKAAATEGKGQGTGGSSQAAASSDKGAEVMRADNPEIRVLSIDWKGKYKPVEEHIQQKKKDAVRAMGILEATMTGDGDDAGAPGAGDTKGGGVDVGAGRIQRLLTQFPGAVARMHGDAYQLE